MRISCAGLLTVAVLVVAILATGVQGADVAYKTPGRPPSPDEKAFFVALLEAGREKIKSGDYFLDGHLTCTEWIESSAIQIQAIFVRPRGFLKYDESLPIANADQPAIPGRYRAIAVRHPDSNMEWMSGFYGSESLILKKSTAKQDDLFWLTDIRAIGLEETGIWLSEEPTFTNSVRALKRTKLISVHEVDGKEVVITD